MQQRQVDAEQGGRLIFSSGTEINIPARAFVYPTTGEEVKGPVTLSVREYGNTAEIILSGIPMSHYDDQTQSWQNFSTAGMFEIRGMDKDQQPVEIAPERTLEVHYASTVEGTYDYWYFDEVKGDWELKGQNTGESFSPPNNQKNSATVQPNRPTAPRKYNPDAIRVTFPGMNLSDFPELNDPNNVALQYAGKPGDEKDPNANEWIFFERWYEAKLTRSAQAGVYQLYLENDDKEFTTQVHATLLPTAYASALNEYRQKLTAYETAIRNKEQGRQRATFIRRSMQVGRFGIYNYDVYGSWEEPVFANANFEPSGQKSWTNLKEVYLITDDGKITVRYPKSDWKQFNFDRNRRNLLLGITSDLEIVIMNPEDFAYQSTNLATRSPLQKWDCVLEENAFKLDSPTNLQSLIDTHFNS